MNAEFPGGASRSSPVAAERGAAGAGLEGGARRWGKVFRAVSHDHSGHCPSNQVPIFTIEDDRAAIGHVADGVDLQRQRDWLDRRRVERQEPCRSCWARYLCGGCHYEVIHRGRPACDYIRGWLDYALGAYVCLSRQRPDLFGDCRHPGSLPAAEPAG